MGKEVDIEHVFDDILDRDEQVIKIIKPSKSRYWKFFLMPLIIPIFLPHFIVVMAVTLFFIIPLLYAHSYNNLYYCYTNKRLIKRSGTIGVDYHTLDYKQISSSSVNVDLLDKLGKKTTGTVYFRSPTSGISFSNVENPYDLLREIKEYINTVTENNTQN